MKTRHNYYATRKVIGWFDVSLFQLLQLVHLVFFLFIFLLFLVAHRSEYYHRQQWFTIDSTESEVGWTSDTKHTVKGTTRPKSKEWRPNKIEIDQSAYTEDQTKTSRNTKIKRSPKFKATHSRTIDIRWIDRKWITTESKSTENP